MRSMINIRAILTSACEKSIKIDYYTVIFLHHINIIFNERKARYQSLSNGVKARRGTLRITSS